MERIVKKTDDIFPIEVYLIGKTIGLSIERATQLKEELEEVLQEAKTESISTTPDN